MIPWVRLILPASVPPFFHSRDETSCYSSGNANGRIFLKCCQCTMMNRLLPVDYMSNYRVDCTHLVITYGIRRTELYHAHKNRKEPNKATKMYLSLICKWETNFLSSVLEVTILFSRCINIIVKTFQTIF